jgi:hypothetical protein
MRPFLALMITLCLLGGVFGYVRFAESVRRPAVDIQINYAEGEYSVDIDMTFDCAGDPIFETDAIKVLFKGEKVFAAADPIPAAQSIEIRPLPGVEKGENEIYVAANRETSTSGFGALKIVVKRNDIPIAEKTITSDEGLAEVGGPVVFRVGPSNESDEHDH